MPYPDGSSLNQYIDTQGMTGPPTNKVTSSDIQYPPMKAKKMTIFNDREREEIKQMMREVLDEYFPDNYNNESNEWLYRGTY